jgi:RNA polymerase sigma-70 factor, ECF subfamily
VTDEGPSSQSQEVDLECSQPASALRAGQDPDPRAFRVLFEAEFSYVFHSLRRLGVREADQEDLTHDVFVIAYRRLPDFDTTRSLRPWLFGIAFRVASDYRRRARHLREVADADEAEPVDQAPLADRQLAGEQTRQLVLDALDHLDLDRRAVLVMHDIDGYAIPKVAQALSIPLNTAYSRLRLAREQFKAAVQRIQLRRENQ